MQRPARKAPASPSTDNIQIGGVWGGQSNPMANVRRKPQRHDTALHPGSAGALPDLVLPAV
jgi:hypothetical protein